MKNIFTSLVLIFLVHTVFGQSLAEKDITITLFSNVKTYTQKANDQPLEGNHTIQMKNGNKYSASFNRGKVDGEFHQYNREGSILFTQNYKKGILDGKQTVFYPNGKIMETYTIKNKQIEGIVKVYDKEGEVIHERMFKDGKEIKKESPQKPKPIRQK